MSGALGEMGFHPRTLAVFAALADKDIDGVVRALAARIDRWYIGALHGARGLSAEALRQRMLDAGIAADTIDASPDIARAFGKARDAATEADRIVVFGSFVTVAAAIAAGAASPPA